MPHEEMTGWFVGLILLKNRRKWPLSAVVESWEFQIHRQVSDFHVSGILQAYYDKWHKVKMGSVSSLS